MRVSIFGSGYVGLVSAVCFAQMGNDVICVDVNQARVDRLNAHECPLYEPGLPEMLTDNVQAKRLSFTTDPKQAVDHAEIIFIAVGTPPEEDGSADLQYVLAVAKTIGEHIQDYTVIVNKSTVPVGTADLVTEAIAAELERRGATVPFDVLSNPEFLKEGCAVQDCMRPDRIVIGSRSTRATDLMKTLYAPFNRNSDRLLVMDVRSAELTKYAANAMLATKISFMNEMSQIAERVGADIEDIRIGIGSDHRIGYAFIYPSCGYGGSCFPKDVQALVRTAHDYAYNASILTSVHAVNESQKRVLLKKIMQHFHQDIAGKTIAVWGLAFKPNTDDIREAPSRTLIEGLWQHGAQVRAYDPQASGVFADVYGERDDLVLCEDQYGALLGADALVVVTEWTQFRSPDFVKIAEMLSMPVIFDGRNLYDRQYLTQQGFTYHSIGRTVCEPVAVE